MRLGSRPVLTGIVVLAALSVGSVVTARLPDAEQVLDRPFERAAAVGQSVELRNLVVSTGQVRAGKQAVLDGQTFGTQGHWLVVEVTLAARREPVALIASLRTTDGRRYGGQTAAKPACGLAQVGLQRRCLAVFEVPAGAMQGAELLVQASATSQGDDVAVVDLGIDQARANELEATTGAVQLAVAR